MPLGKKQKKQAVPSNVTPTQHQKYSEGLYQQSVSTYQPTLKNADASIYAQIPGRAKKVVNPVPTISYDRKTVPRALSQTWQNLDILEHMITYEDEKRPNRVALTQYGSFEVQRQIKKATPVPQDLEQREAVNVSEQGSFNEAR